MLLLVDSLSCFDENREVTDYFNSYVMDIIKRIIDESREDK
jgi:Ulp1 family protease